MSLYGVSVYGNANYGPAAGVPGDYSSASFRATPVYYNTLKLEWSMPKGVWKAFLLLKNPYGYPVDTDDGTPVIESVSGSPQYFFDFNLVQGREYYYAIFVQDAENVWHRSAITRGLSVKDFNTYSTMWSYLPLAVRSATRNVIDTNPENKDLSDFIKLISFEYDYEKTQAFLLKQTYVPDLITQPALPSIMANFGLEYEPSVSDQRLRVLLKNAISIYQAKGSVAGVIEFVKSFTGYDATVSVGKNLILTYNDSSFEESVGNWASSGASLASVGTLVLAPYAEPSLPTAFPNRQLGSLRVTSTAGGTVDLVCGDSAPKTKGIPVKGSLNYTFTVYTKAATTARGISLSIKWYNIKGQYISADLGASSNNATGSWGRKTVSAAAPADAAYATLKISIAGTSSSEVHYFDAAQLEQNSSATTFEDARLIKIGLYPNRINELPNPNFTVNANNWTVTNCDRFEIVDSAGVNPHIPLNGAALEVYPENLNPATVYSDNVSTIIANEYYTFSMYASIGSYGPVLTKTEDEVKVSITWLDGALTTLLEDDGEILKVVRDTKSNWETTAAVLGNENLGIEIETLKFKVGDGITPWNLLPYASSSLEYVYAASGSWAGSTVLGNNVIGVETDTFKFKIGDGTTNWATLNYTTSLPAWVRPSVTSKAPSNAVYARCTLEWTPANTSNALLVDQALFENEPTTASFFDGSGGFEDMSGLVWEGAVNGSRSLYYRNNAAVSSRLNSLLPEFLPLGSTFAFYYDS